MKRCCYRVDVWLGNAEGDTDGDGDGVTVMFVGCVWFVGLVWLEGRSIVVWFSICCINVVVWLSGPVADM